MQGGFHLPPVSPLLIKRGEGKRKLLPRGGKIKKEKGKVRDGLSKRGVEKTWEGFIFKPLKRRRIKGTSFKIDFEPQIKAEKVKQFLRVILNPGNVILKEFLYVFHIKKFLQKAGRSIK